MNASAAIQVLPTVSTDEEVICIVDEVIDYIKSTVLNYRPEGEVLTIEKKVTKHHQ